MDELDELKEIWKSAPESSDTQDISSFSIDDAINRYQRKVRRTNIAASIYMSLTIVFLIFLMVVFSDESWLFYASVIAVVLLSAGMIWLMWTRDLDFRKKIILSASEYTNYQLKKLKRSKKIIEYSPLYGLLLGLCISAYSYSLMSHASVEFVFWASNINWVYIVVVSFLSYRFKMKRFNRDVQPIVDELEAFNS